MQRELFENAGIQTMFSLSNFGVNLCTGKYGKYFLKEK